MLDSTGVEVNPDGSPTWLRPHWLQRLGLLVPIVIVVGATFSVWVDDRSAASDSLMAVVGSLGVYCSARWLLLAGVRRSRETIVVHGVLWSRRIRLAQIDKVSKGYVAVYWRARTGQMIITPVTALWSRPRPLPMVTRYSNHAVDAIREWVRFEKQISNRTELAPSRDPHDGSNRSSTAT